MSSDLLKPGDAAPAFDARGSDGQRHTLASLLAAGPVVLIFYPGNNTPGCNRQLSTVRDALHRFEAAGVQPLGVNPATVEAHMRYAGKMEFGFPLLSDPDREIARAYGALKPDGRGIQRTVYAIARDGRIAFGVRGAPAPADVIAAVES
jgi:peroxiredoxin Q/BCP